MCHRKRLFGKRPFKESMGRRRGVGVVIKKGEGMGLVFGKPLGRIGMWLAVKYPLKWRMRRR